MDFRTQPPHRSEYRSLSNPLTENSILPSVSKRLFVFPYTGVILYAVWCHTQGLLLMLPIPWCTLNSEGGLYVLATLYGQIRVTMATPPPQVLTTDLPKIV